VGRQYHLFDYVGAPDAERVVVMMGSGADTTEQTVKHLVAQGEKVGLLKVRLFRPFSIEHFAAALPKTVKFITAMDRTRNRAAGEPTCMDVVTALAEAGIPMVLGGRYGLASKEFTPAMAKVVFENMAVPAGRNWAEEPYRGH
jgi:pyruvate-ferredoxin/flavodoxin oxidoreductase